MKSLTVLYDPDCPLCTRSRAWLEGQPKYVAMEFVAAGSPEARRRFPEIDPDETRSDLTVVADGRDVYRGAGAYLVCLWALRQHRAWALRLGHPRALPLAKRFFEEVTKWRYGIGNTLGREARAPAP